MFMPIAVTSLFPFYLLAIGFFEAGISLTAGMATLRMKLTSTRPQDSAKTSIQLFINYSMGSGQLENAFTYTLVLDIVVRGNVYRQFEDPLRVDNRHFLFA
jgi:hypothetical protein